MECSKVKEKIKAYLDRELKEKEVQPVQIHLQNCTTCAKELEILSKTWDLLLELPEPEKVPDLTPGILDRIRTQPKETVWEKIARWLAPVTGPAVAATALALGLYIGTSIGTSISQSYITFKEPEDPLYLEVFNDVPPQSIGDAYLSINEGKEG